MTQTFGRQGYGYILGPTPEWPLPRKLQTPYKRVLITLQIEGVPRTVSARFSLFLPSSRAASPAVGSMSTYGSPGKTAGPAAGHTPYAASWTAKLSRTGQTHAWRAHTSPPRRGGRPVPVFSPDRPGWNERIPVWEQRIPQWQSGQSGWQTAPMLSTRQQQPTRAFLTPSPSMASQTSAVPGAPFEHRREPVHALAPAL